jgi:hypothetical protein
MNLPRIPGVPDYDSLLIRGIKNANDEPALAALEPEERKAALAALAESAARASYHKQRFDELLVAMRTRRDAVGGPVVSDWHAAPPLIWEGVAFLGAARTAVDVLVYLAARRAGKSIVGAKGWDAGEAIAPKETGGTSPTRYDVPEILAIRALGRWFKELNVYRNVVYHRGWGGQSYGLFTRADTAEEASLSGFNALLLPDFASLDARKLQHEWTYADGSRLDELVERTDTGLNTLLRSVFVEVWGCAIPAPGTAEHPSCALYLPTPAVLVFTDLAVVPLFTSKTAANTFADYPADADLSLRAIRPTTLDGGELAYLLWVNAEAHPKPYCARVFQMTEGKCVSTGDAPFDPTLDLLNGWPGVIALRAPGHAVPTFYAWQARNHAAAAP